MADTEVKQMKETDLSVKLNGSLHVDNEKSSEACKTSKMIDTGDQNCSSNLTLDKKCIESKKSISNCSNDGEDDYSELIDNDNGSDNENHINNKDCKSDISILEDNLTHDSENATMNSDDLYDAENSCNGTKEINRNDSVEQMEVDTVEEQKADDDEQMDYDDDDDEEEEEDRLNDQNDTESRSNEIKKSLEDSSINLDKSVTIVKVSDPKQSSGSSGKKKLKVCLI